MITPSIFIGITDAITALTLQVVPAGAYGNQSGSVGNVGGSSGYGDSNYTAGQTGDYGMLKAARDLENLMLGKAVSGFTTIAADYDTIASIGPAVHGLQTSLPLQSQLKTNLQQTMQQLNSLCGSAGIAGVTSIDTWATYYNTGAGGPFNALIKPDFQTVHKICLGSFLSPNNIFTPALANIATLTYPSTYTTFKPLTTANGLTLFGGAGAGQITANVTLAAGHGLATGNYVVVFKGTGVTSAGVAFASGDAGHFFKSSVLAVTNGVAFSNAAVTFTANAAGDVLSQIATPSSGNTIGIYASPYTDGVTAAEAPAGASSVVLNVAVLR